MSDSDVQVGRQSLNPKLIGAIAVALILAILLMIFSGEPEPDIEGSALISLKKHNELIVQSVQLERTVMNSEPVALGTLKATQIMRVPVTVEYRLSLKELKPENFAWDTASHTLNITVPEVMVTEPRVDVVNAKVELSGLWIPREVQKRLSQRNFASARSGALRDANTPLFLERARSAAREAVIENVKTPLRAVGYSDARINVRFSDEPGVAPSYIDQSRSYNEVLEERAKQRANGAQ